ncbi:hypothetical protein [Sediminicurvatus halobius]|uniref:DUF5596 domain-containing protein n=1 Tax=Sediminicurvatus halobius TaxID=2182432 RepID=A0A2U2MYB9_9GAMM|nr:hypothetical protein [Spiribacter halobius]PWG61694.1 hypothetical protein DEM34_15145 [Spiribacter halobius]UEX77318.1 hypothetical protein LMH63_15420 [Spiribacter halobius]
MTSDPEPVHEGPGWPACDAAIIRDREALDPSLLNEHPPEGMVQVLLASDYKRRYNQPPERLLRAWQAAEAGRAPESGTRYLRLLLATALTQLPALTERSAVPPCVQTLLRREALRISGRLESEPLQPLSPDDDLYLKDLALCRLKLLPVGAELVERDAGIPRSLLWRGGARQLLRGAPFFAFVTRGFRPFFTLHMDPRRLEEFSPAGWERTYHRIAALLKRHPEVKGVFGTAWFYDPAVARISPHLAYLRELRERHGAMSFRYGPTESARRNATATSRTRRRLMEDGRYEPTSYYVVWPRRALIDWARRHPESAGGGA